MQLSRLTIGLLVAAVISGAFSMSVFAQTNSSKRATRSAPANPFAGNWTYRSFRNNPDPVGDVTQDPSKLVKLLFAEAEWVVHYTSGKTFRGELRFGPDDVMDLVGTTTLAKKWCPARVHIVGKGRAGTSTEHLFYDYEGSLVELWPNGINQRRAIVGSVIRVKPHDNAPAGYVASFIAVKRD